MKGIIFTELFEMTEAQYGPQFVNTVIDKVQPESKGVYTSIGNYKHSELVDIMRCMAKEGQTSMRELMFKYGVYMFNKFTEYYAVFFENVTHPFDFLESVDAHIHQEVLKLYPNAELPRFDCTRLDDNTLEMIYYSTRRMEDFAHGLISECLKYFGANGKISMKEINSDQVIFTIELDE